MKDLGTNGGDLFNVNSAHAYSNPNGFSDFVELYALVLIGFALPFTFGRMIKDKRQGYAVVTIMFVIFLAATLSLMFLEVGGNPKLTDGGATQKVTATSPGGNAEGKEVRFVPSASGLWGAATTGTSTCSPRLVSKRAGAAKGPGPPVAAQVC